jgi:hypothetical protein
LLLNEDYQFTVTGLNPIEGLASLPLQIRAAGLPNAPGAITEVALSRSGTSISLDWVVPADDGGSPIIAYTLVRVVPNIRDALEFYGNALTTAV